MLIEAVNLHIILQSLPAWGVRVEIGPARARVRRDGSLPAWGVRVEIRAAADESEAQEVTPRMGSAG